MKVCFETFGCRLSRAEALQQEADYLAAGWETTHGHADADLVIVRGCSVTAKAQRDCERLVDHIKRKYPNIPVLIQGCLLAKKNDNAPFTSTRGKIIQRQMAAVSDGAATPARSARAYLKVQDGCAGGCTFCIVPKFRGKSSSVPFPDVVDKARRFVDAGYHEIVVTGCNLALYASEGKRLPDLVAALAELDPAGCRIRLGSLLPGGPALETVMAMSEHANVCRFLHLPIQSGSNIMLHAMGRPYQVADVERLIRSATKLMPQLGLGCDLMTGFPGEGDIEFMATKGLLKRFPFTNAHVFPYSERPDTSAPLLPFSISRDIRSARAHELSGLAVKLRADYARRFVGKTVEVVIEDETKLAGWTPEYLWCSAHNSLTKKSAAGTRKRKMAFRVIEVHQDRLKGVLV